jgi:hypothetical protein
MQLSHQPEAVSKISMGEVSRWARALMVVMAATTTACHKVTNVGSSGDHSPQGNSRQYDESIEHCDLDAVISSGKLLDRHVQFHPGIDAPRLIEELYDLDDDGMGDCFVEVEYSYPMKTVVSGNGVDTELRVEFSLEVSNGPQVDFREMTWPERGDSVTLVGFDHDRDGTLDTMEGTLNGQDFGINTSNELTLDGVEEAIRAYLSLNLSDIVAPPQNFLQGNEHPTHRL